MPFQNRLLAALSVDDRALIHPHLDFVDLPLNTVLIAPDQPIRHLTFPEEGLCSVVGDTRDARIEIGLFGRDGLSGTALVLGSDRIPHRIFMQVGGHGHRIAASSLPVVLDASAALRSLLLRYAQTFLTQTAQTALANASAPIEQRLARWLLMYHDRQDGDDLSVTHDFLSMMLGVRRPGVTMALHKLEGAGSIRARRGRITVLSRAGLEEAAADAYGPAEDEYERLIGPLRRAPAGHREAVS